MWFAVVALLLSFVLASLVGSVLGLIGRVQELEGRVRELTVLRVTDLEQMRQMAIGLEELSGLAEFLARRKGSAVKMDAKARAN